ncbi:MAG TPA: hypothetical protein VHC69_03235 [Polyangiaceae bacterium]|nr:hypothetical protein [Polyangiaceae bacterium]
MTSIDLVLRPALLCAAAWLACGCRCTEDRPYTPFHIDPPKPTAPSSAAASAPVPTASGSAAPEVHQAEVAPQDVSEWTVDGVALGVAPERLIERALAADFDGDGQKEAVAWTRARSDPPDVESSGELMLVGPKAPLPGRVLAKLPSYMPTGPGCHHTVSLSQTGPETVTLDVRARCEAALVPRSPTRGVVVLSPSGDRATVLELRVADPAPSEALSIAVDSTDRDGDGRDDVRVSVTLGPEGPDAVDATADLVWLDRTAGPSRDSSEPAHSLAALASMAAVHTSGKSTSRQVPARVASARRLYATLCAESGTPRIFDADGAPLICSGVATALATLFSAEVHALIARRDAAGATAALARDGWYQGALPAKQRASLEKDLGAVWPKRSATERPLDVAPRAKSGLPRFSPLSFDADGTLLVQTQDGLRRVHPDDGRVEDATDGVDAWPLAVGTGNAPRWTGIAFPCERSEVLLLESDPTGTPLPSKPTRLIAPRPGPCRHSGPLPTPSLTPLEWTDTRQVGLIGGALFGANELSELGPPAQKGTPRSADGKALVAPTPFGVVVAAAKTEIWSAQEPAALSDCVVANGAQRVACVRAEHAVVITPDGPAGRKK